MTPRLALVVLLLTGAALPAHAQPINFCDTLEREGAHVSDPAFDSTPAFNAFLASANNHLCLDAGAYYFLTKPNAIQKPVRITGVSVSKSALVKAYATSNVLGEGAIWLLGANASGSVLEHLSLPANAPASHGVLIYVQSQLGSPVSYLLFNDINITYAAGASYDEAILIDGTAASTAAQGVRFAKFENLSLFLPPSGGYWTLQCFNCIGAMFANVWTNGSIDIDGWYTTYGQSASVAMSNVVAGGEIAFSMGTGFTCASCQASTFTFLGYASNGSIIGWAPTIHNWGVNTHVSQ